MPHSNQNPPNGLRLVSSLNSPASISLNQQPFTPKSSALQEVMPRFFYEVYRDYRFDNTFNSNLLSFAAPKTRKPNLQSRKLLKPKPEPLPIETSSPWQVCEDS